MEFTKRDFKKPELTDPADIRDLNENSDSLEDHLNAITGYDYGKTIVLGTDAVEINKIHLNKIPSDPDFGKYFLILTGSTWDTSTKEEYDMKTNPSLNSKLDKGAVSPEYDTAKKIEDIIKNSLEMKVLYTNPGTTSPGGSTITINEDASNFEELIINFVFDTPGGSSFAGLYPTTVRTNVLVNNVHVIGVSNNDGGGTSDDILSVRLDYLTSTTFTVNKLSRSWNGYIKEIIGKSRK